MAPGTSTLLIIAPLTLLSMRVLTPRGWAALWRFPVLLVPVLLAAGIPLTGQLVAGGFAALGVRSAGGMLGALFVLAALVVGVIFSSVTTALVLEAAAGRSPSLERAYTRGLPWIPRALGLTVLAWLPMAMALALAWVLGAGGITVAMVVIAAGAFATNLFTTALLPVALPHGGTFRAALIDGVDASVRLARRFFAPVVAQLALLGSGTFVVARSEGREAWSWHVNFVWLGGYPTENHWYTDLVKLLKTQASPWLTAAFAALAAAAALALQIEVAKALQPAVLQTAAPAPTPASQEAE